MFRPPFLARVAAGAAVYALEETRRLPATAVQLPLTAVSQLLQTSMHIQQFITSLALKGDAVFDRLSNPAEDAPAWATFDEDEGEADLPAAVRTSRFDLYTTEEPEPTADLVTGRNGATVLHDTDDASTQGDEVAGAGTTARGPEPVEEVEELEVELTEDLPVEGGLAEVIEPAVATRYDYANMTLAQLRARLRMLTLDDLTTLLDYEQRTRARAAFVTMLTNRIATVRAQ